MLFCSVSDFKDRPYALAPSTFPPKQKDANESNYKPWHSKTFTVSLEWTTSRKERLKCLEDFCLKNGSRQSRNQALTALCAPNSLDSGQPCAKHSKPGKCVFKMLDRYMCAAVGHTLKDDLEPMTKRLKKREIRERSGFIIRIFLASSETARLTFFFSFIALQPRVE